MCLRMERLCVRVQNTGFQMVSTMQRESTAIWNPRCSYTHSAIIPLRRERGNTWSLIFKVYLRRRGMALRRMYWLFLTYTRTRGRERKTVVLVELAEERNEGVLWDPRVYWRLPIWDCWVCKRLTRRFLMERCNHILGVVWWFAFAAGLSRRWYCRLVCLTCSTAIQE